LQQSLESRRLEIAYLKACHEVEAVCEAEKVRQLRVQLLLLEDDNNELQAQLAQDDDRIDDLERHNQELQEDLDACERKLESTQGDLRIRSREIETLKVRWTRSDAIGNNKLMLITRPS
jgi:chromosome segregation ATPase